MASIRDSYLVNCPSCGLSNRVPAEMAGRVGKCGACHAPLPPIHLEPLPLGDNSFREFLRDYPGPVLAEFWAPW